MQQSPDSGVSPAPKSVLDPAHPLEIGVIGTSPGNGHPYSWSAILNGYERELMASCPFPVIPSYLAQHDIGTGALPEVQVTAVWTQDRDVSADIAATCRIATVCDSPEELVESVDAVLVARDDPESHPYFAQLLVERGRPGYIDKPFSLSLQGAEAMFGQDPNEQLLFTCSGLRFAPELQPFLAPGSPEPQSIRGVAPKGWDRYAIHVIEPALRLIDPGAQIADSTVSRVGQRTSLEVKWTSGSITEFVTTGEPGTPISLEIDGVVVQFRDTFTAFLSALESFVGFVRRGSGPIPRPETLRVIEVIERGMR